MTRRYATRALPATPDDLKRFAGLALAARKAAEDPGGDIKAIAKARNRVRNRTMPKGQGVPGSAFDRLCRLTERWPGMLATARMDEAPALAGLATQCLDILRALDDAPLLPPARADIHG